jgi:hypothetical protein
MTISLEEILETDDDLQTREGKFTPFSKLPDHQKLKQAKSMLRTAVSADTNFQKEATEDFAFRAGHQWTAEEKRSRFCGYKFSKRGDRRFCF